MSSYQLNEVFKNLSLDAKCVNFYSTSSSNFYDVELGNSITIDKFISLNKDLQFRIKSPNTLYLKVLPEKGVVRIQDLKKSGSNHNFMDNISKMSKENISIILGKDYEDNLLVSDFTAHPHTLMAGTTGSGKSIALHNIICNALFNQNVDIFLSDPKKVEFSIYENLNSVKSIASSYNENVKLFQNLDRLMDQRFKIMNMLKVNNYKKIISFNPILVVIDELSDLILQDKKNIFKDSLLKICQKSRAAGIFIVAATQRPSVDVLSGLIKANFPARIALKTASPIDSKVILDEVGAESLQGGGDAIIKNHQYSSLRFKFPFIDPVEVVKKLNENIQS